MDSALPQKVSNLLRDGVVVEVDHHAALCRVQSGQMVTDFIPWLVAAAGSVRTWSAPAEGEQVQLLSSDGDLANAVALSGLYSNAFPAPSNNADQTSIHFSDGAVLAYDSASHVLNATLPAGGMVNLVADAGVTITGPVTITGAVTIAGDVAVDGQLDATGDVVGDGISLVRHAHGGVQPGGGNSGPPQ